MPLAFHLNTGFVLKILTVICLNKKDNPCFSVTVKILKFGTPQTIAIIVLKIETFNVTLH